MKNQTVDYTLIEKYLGERAVADFESVEQIDEYFAVIAFGAMHSGAVDPLEIDLAHVETVTAYHLWG